MPSAQRAASRDSSSRFQRGVRASGSSGSATAYRRMLERVPAPPRASSRSRSSASASCRSLVLTPWLGQDFFPSVDAGQIKLHLRARTGTRIEETARLCDRIERSIRADRFRRSELETIIDNIGLPYSGINLSYSNSAPIGPADADILISLKARPSPDRPGTSSDLRPTLPQRVSRRHVLLPAGRHRQPDPELRPARADRRPDRRQQPRGQPRVRGQAAAADAPGARASRTCASSSPSTQPQPDRRRRPRPARSELGFTQRDVASNLLDLALAAASRRRRRSGSTRRTA